MPKTKKIGRPTMSPQERARVRGAVAEIVTKEGTREGGARRIGVTLFTVSRILDRRGGPSRDTARKVAAAVGLTVEDLMAGKASVEVRASASPSEVREARREKDYVFGKVRR